MESLKVIIVRDDQGKALPTKNFPAEELIKDSVFQYATWKSPKLQELKVHLVVISPELALDKAKHAIKKIREKNDVIPIIAIRTESSIIYKASLFDAGLDDYLCLPFDGKELNYRIDVLIRRAKPLKSDIPELSK